MPAPGPWTICYTPPGGEQSCFEIPEVAKWPDDIDQPDPVILDQIGRLQKLASEVTEPKLKMQLTLTLDQAVDRVSAQLPAGFEFHRASVGFGGLPTEWVTPRPLDDVTGWPQALGWADLQNTGYTVRISTTSTGDPAQNEIIMAQDPPAGTVAEPLGTVVTLTVAHFPSFPTPPVWWVPTNEGGPG
jgi:hypothetical protein